MSNFLVEQLAGIFQNQSIFSEFSLVPTKSFIGTIDTSSDTRVSLPSEERLQYREVKAVPASKGLGIRSIHRFSSTVETLE